MRLFVKIHKSYRTVVAVCDENIAGKRFEEGEKLLDVRENFYKSESLTYIKVVELMQFQAKEDATFNIVGQESIKAAQEAGIIDHEGVGEIDGIPYALVLF